MNLKLQYLIREDQLQHRYLRENSYWYKYLNRTDNYYKQFIEEMKKQYKLTASDKINKMMDNINMLSTFLEVLK